MRIWFALLAALVLAFSVWSGGTADAAVAHQWKSEPQFATCVDLGADEEPGCPLTGTHHHHASCGAHNVATPSAAATAGQVIAARAVIGTPAVGSLRGRSPPSELRPPIA